MAFSDEEAAAYFNLRLLMVSVQYEAGLTFGALCADPEVQARWMQYAEAIPPAVSDETWHHQVTHVCCCGCWGVGHGCVCVHDFACVCVRVCACMRCGGAGVGLRRSRLPPTAAFCSATHRTPFGRQARLCPCTLGACLA